MSEGTVAERARKLMNDDRAMELYLDARRKLLLPTDKWPFEEQALFMLGLVLAERLPKEAK